MRPRQSVLSHKGQSSAREVDLLSGVYTQQAVVLLPPVNDPSGLSHDNRTLSVTSLRITHIAIKAGTTFHVAGISVPTPESNAPTHLLDSARTIASQQIKLQNVEQGVSVLCLGKSNAPVQKKRHGCENTWVREKTYGYCSSPNNNKLWNDN